MANKKSMSFGARMRSISYAVAGLVTLLKQEANMRIHLIATMAVIIAGIVKGIERSGWIALAFAIALVWITEAFNTVLEIFCDLASDNQYHPVIKKIKDISAAAVMIAAIASIVVGVMIFLN